MGTLRVFGIAVALALARCGAPVVTKPVVTRPVPVTEPWTTTVDAHHPLVGKTYDAQSHAFVPRERAEAATFDAPFVLLGEKHDNADHHRLQAHALASLVAHGRRPAVLFEMIDLDLQPALDRYLAQKDATVDGLRNVLEWDERGWPAWSLYRPLFEVALGAHLKLVATGLEHAIVRKLVKEGLSALPPEIAARVHVEPLAPALATSLDEEIKSSHCGALPESMIAPMSLAQRVKDVWMAALMVAHESSDGVVLVAGNGHTRTDRGVPLELARIAPSARAITLSFVEVSVARDPAAYVAEEPASFLVFTPRVDDDDPCAKFREAK